MKTKTKYLMLALVAVFTCVSFSSCRDDGEDPNKGIGNYYLQLYAVETNCVDANTGNSLADAFMAEWISANQADSEGIKKIGKIDNETARAWFNQYISSFVEANNEAFAGKNLLPENGWILYSFYLDSDASYSGATEKVVIEVDNSGARER